MMDWGITAYMTSERPPTDMKVEKTVTVRCPYCKATPDAAIMGFLVTRPNRFHRLPSDEMNIYNYLLRCTRCNGAVLLLWTYDFGGAAAIGGGPAFSAGRLQFPAAIEAFSEEDLEPAVPKAIAIDVAQAELSLQAGAIYGTAMLYRRACQYICRDKGCNQSVGLKAQINELATKNVITNDMAEMAHTVRIIGNEIAHPSASDPFLISQEDVAAAREILRQLVQIVYINPYKSKKIRDGLKQKGVKGAQ